MISSEKVHLLKSWHLAKFLLALFFLNCVYMFMCACSFWGREVGSNSINRRRTPKILMSQGQSEEQNHTLSPSYPLCGLWNRLPSGAPGQMPDPSVPQSGQIHAGRLMSCLLLNSSTWQFPTSIHLQEFPCACLSQERSALEDRSIFTWKHKECLLFQREGTKNWTFMCQRRIQPTCRWGPGPPSPL